MDHTPSDIIVVDNNSMLPLGRPTVTSALDEHTRSPMGFYTGFEPPSCLSVMRFRADRRLVHIYESGVRTKPLARRTLRVWLIRQMGLRAG
jgi:hypothetical protein